MSKKKLSLELTPEMEEVLDELVEARGLPKAQVLRRAVLLMKYLDDQTAQNKDVLVRDNDTGQAERLVLESQMTRSTSTASAVSGTAASAASKAAKGQTA